MKITKNWLIKNATDQSYSRGSGYESSVRKLKKVGDTYTAKVDGSETYKVEITESIDDIETYCDCPYDYEGICKHIVAVGLNILSGNFKEEKPSAAPPILVALPELTEEKVDTATFYQKEFLNAKKKKQDEFIKLLFTQDATICRQFLSYIRPPAPPLSIASTDITELSNEIAAKLMEIDTDDYLSDDDDDDYGGRGYRGRYDYNEYDEEGESYDTDALEKEVSKLLEPYGKMSVQLLEKGQFLDSIRVLLAIYEAMFIVEDPELNEYNEFSYADEIDTFFEQTTGNWIEKTIYKTIKKSDYDAILALILEHWQAFKRFHNKETLAPYELLDEELFYFIVQKAQSEEMFFDLMTANNLHTTKHYQLTKKLCIALGKDNFLLEQLAKYALDSMELSKELMEKYIARDNRNGFVAIAQKACEKFNWQINEFVAERILPTDNLGFFKKILSETATRNQRLDLFHRWREHVSSVEQENYLQSHSTSNGSFHITLLADAKRFSDILIFAEKNLENFSYATIFPKAAELVLNIYPNEIFSLYCERVALYMGNGGQGRDHYKQAVEMLKPVKNIKNKENDIKVFVNQLRSKYNRLPAFLDELKRGGF